MANNAEELIITEKIMTYVIWMENQRKRARFPPPTKCMNVSIAIGVVKVCATYFFTKLTSQPLVLFRSGIGLGSPSAVLPEKSISALSILTPLSLPNASFSPHLVGLTLFGTGFKPNSRRQ